MMVNRVSCEKWNKNDRKVYVFYEEKIQINVHHFVIKQVLYSVYHLSYEGQEGVIIKERILMTVNHVFYWQVTVGVQANTFHSLQPN